MKIQLLGWFDKNFGDDVMQKIVTESMPCDDFFVSCAQKEFLTHFKDCENVHICDKMPKVDACVNVVGTGFKYDSKIGIIQKIVSDFGDKGMMAPKTAVIGCSVDRPHGFLQKRLMKKELGKYEFISCRDEVSKKIIGDLSKKSVVKCHDDIVFSLDRRYVKRRECEECLGVIPVQRMFSADNYKYYAALAGVCDDYAEKYGRKALIFAFATGNENDILAAMTIKRLMIHKDMAEIIAYDCDIEYIFENLSRCGAVISSRFHGIITAMLAGVPVTAVSDTSKVDIICEKFGIKRFAKNKLNPNELENALRTDLIFNLDLACADAAEHLKELKNYIEN